MKKILLLSAMIAFTWINGLKAQVFPGTHGLKLSSKTNPIPSFNFQLTENYAVFQERVGSGTKEKRDMNVVVKSSSKAEGEIFATVWVYKINGNETLGPFTVYCNDPLIVDINGDKWGVTVASYWDLSVDVWIAKGH
jgi:hypothetical protein